MPALRSAYSREITNQTTSKKRFEFRQQEEKYTEPKLLPRLPLTQEKKTCTFKVLFEYSLEGSL